MILIVINNAQIVIEVTRVWTAILRREVTIWVWRRCVLLRHEKVHECMSWNKNIFSNLSDFFPSKDCGEVKPKCDKISRVNQKWNGIPLSRNFVNWLNNSGWTWHWMLKVKVSKDALILMQDFSFYIQYILSRE